MVTRSSLRIPFTAWIALLAALWPLAARPSGPLPEPLTLEYALSLADEPHPELEAARAGVEQARAELASATARYGLNATLEGRARWVQPQPVAGDGIADDHRTSLVLRRNLYDFGRSDGLGRSAESRLAGAGYRLQELSARRRIAIMEAYFAVLIADLEFTREDEAMAVAFVTLDRLRSRHELGQISDVDLLASESDYQAARRSRYAAEGRQRLARSALADLLNRPGDLPSTLEPPSLPHREREPGEVESLYRAALERNPGLLALRAQREAARQRLLAAEAEGRPRLSGEVEAAAYSRRLAANDEWRAGLFLEVPLYTGGGVAAIAALRQAEYREAEARLRQAEMETRHAILDLWLRLQTLRFQREEAAALRDYRELYLDRSRTIYEQEVKADLGDAMVRLTEAELAGVRADFERVLAWERLDALTGGAVAGEAVAGGAGGGQGSTE